jgi:hypothetical protein
MQTESLSLISTIKVGAADLAQFILLWHNNKKYLARYLQQFILLCIDSSSQLKNLRLDAVESGGESLEVISFSVLR